MKQIIYGIGGGDMRHKRMEIHYPRIVELARTQFVIERPTITILPTAHHNGSNKKMGRGWMDFIVEKFDSLGCDTENIWIGNQLPGQKVNTNDEVIDILDRSHAVFVLGGDSQYLLEVVCEKGLDPAFKKAIVDGKVMAGTSAGLIWLSTHCMSDSECFHKDQWDYIMLEGLGVLPFAINVHDNGAVPEGIIDKRSRKQQFEEQFLRLDGIKGIAVDEMVGLEIIDGKCVVRTADNSIGAEILTNENGTIKRSKIDVGSGIDLINANALKELQSR